LRLIKGLHYLISACTELTRRSSNYRLVIAGKPKWNEHYWNEVKKAITDSGIEKHIVSRIGFVPDEIELYFKAADVLILPYTISFKAVFFF
jgi:glycosyltransferase involved in cell wall biosynthesis